MELLSSVFIVDINIFVSYYSFLKKKSNEVSQRNIASELVIYLKYILLPYVSDENFSMC